MALLSCPVRSAVLVLPWPVCRCGAGVQLHKKVRHSCAAQAGGSRQQAAHRDHPVAFLLFKSSCIANGGCALQENSSRRPLPPAETNEKGAWQANGFLRGRPLHAQLTYGHIAQLLVVPVPTGLQLLHQLAERRWRQAIVVGARSPRQVEAAAGVTPAWAPFMYDMPFNVYRAPSRLMQRRPLLTHLGWPCLPGNAASSAACSSSAALSADER